ncbi:DNA-formamidopyrimidine glycosylase family protein [Cupriavidus basilensis]
MPELPEVEVTRRGLLPHVVGRRIADVTVRHRGLRWPIRRRPGGAPGRAGLVRRIERRGKYLLLECADEATGDAGWLLVHLGMTGIAAGAARMRPCGCPRPPDLALDGVGGSRIVLRSRDPRRFGAVLWSPLSEAMLPGHPPLRGLGIEPFDPHFDGAWLHRHTRGRSAAIKTVLLAGNIVVGVGNIYASESLFRAGIRPTTPAGRLSLARCERLRAGGARNPGAS